MAEEKVVKLSIDNNQNIENCRKAFKESDFVKAFSFYNGLDAKSQRLLLPEVASFYASVFDACGEYGCLMRMISYPESHNLDPHIIMERLKKFVVPLAGNGYISYYEKLIEKIFGVSVENDDLFDRMESRLKKQSEIEKKHALRMLDDENEGDFLYEQAVLSLTDGKKDEALKLLKKIKPDDKKYIDAQHFFSVISQMNGNLEGAVNSSMTVLKIEPNDMESLKRLLSIAKDYSEYKGQINQFLTSLEYGEFNEDAHFALAKIFIENKEFEKAEAKLNLIKSIFVYGENYLQMQARVYEELGKMDECKNALHTLITIYPKNVRSRYKLRCIEIAESNGLKYTSENETKRMKEEIELFLKNTSEEDFNKLNRTELEYYFRGICYYASDLSLKKSVLVMLTISKLKDVIFDSLLEIETGEKQKEIILSTIIQLAMARDVFAVVYGKLKKIHVDYPKLLYNKNYLDALKSPKSIKSSVNNYRAYLINAYAQAFTVRVFDEGKTSKFSKNAETVIKGIQYLDPIDRVLFDNLDNLVFAFCVADCQMYATSKIMFATIDRKTKQRIINLINKFKVKKSRVF